MTILIVILLNLFSRLQSQLPDLENTLEMIKTMKSHKGQELKTDFLLSDDVYAKASIQGTENVYLWLGVSFFCFFFLKLDIIFFYCCRPMSCWSIISKMPQNLFQEIYN